MKSIVTALAALSFAGAPLAAAAQQQTTTAVPDVPEAGVAEHAADIVPETQIPAGVLVGGGVLLVGATALLISAGDDDDSTDGTTSTTTE